MSSIAANSSHNTEARKLLSTVNSKRFFFYINLALGIIAAILFAVYLISALESRQRPFFGAMLSPYMTVDGARPITAGAWPGQVAGLRFGDQIRTINDRPLFSEAGTPDYGAAQTAFLESMRRAQIGDTLTVTALRMIQPGSRSPSNCDPQATDQVSCTFPYVVSTLPANDFLTFFVIPYVTGLIVVGLGLIVTYLRPEQLNAQMIGMFSILLGVFIGGLYDVDNTYAAITPWIILTAFTGGALGTVALNFPSRVKLVYRYPWLRWLPLAISVPLAALGLFFYFNPRTVNDFPDAWQLGIFYTFLWLVVLIFNLVQQRRMATTAALRDQTNTALIGFALIVVPVLIWVVDTIIQAITGTAFFSVNTSATMPFFIMPSVAMIYAVLQYRTSNTDRVISQGITYSIMLGALVIGYFLLVLGAAFFTNQFLGLQPSDFLVAITIFVIAVLLLPVRTRLQDRIDRIYYRQRVNYQDRVEDFSRTLSALESLDEIVATFRQELTSSLSPSNIFVFFANRQSQDFGAYGKPKPETDIRFENTAGIVHLLQNDELIYLEPGRPWPNELIAEKARLNILGSRLILRMRGRKDLLGFLSIGPSRVPGGRYSFEELRFIQNLTSQLTVALERSQVVDSLERRVRELDVLSQVSQAVNFTFEFDDLLELIYAQTDRLVSAPYFYIALRERGSDKLYFAFFLEEDERYSDHENRRWLMGRDLFSEVVRNAQPMRVDNYVSEMEKRGSTIIFESLNLKSWMGVPLIAGSTVLGVTAVATDDSSKPYTDDQLRIFNDIGTLAATSLDKARLFEETNRRARQLAALNEMSQRLASELNVENLLDLITSSAADILESEAGSLLLMDEQDEMLEFKVAIGGSGQELVGKRIPKNKGLVGEAVNTRKSVIVNEAANDPRWVGEVGKDNFSTNAILAVPLIAQGRVIGVLEVLNKRSGGLYLQEDANLLTTFASQAAIALENARLFQMTDLQLTQRVNELQALERIDVELNRSLDLQKVSEITMRYAISNTAATAGALGIIEGTDDEKYLHIVTLYGYTDEDVPSGAEDRRWPLNKGVVKRVLRTKRADLVPDVTIDPDYVPSLRGSLSQMTIPMMSGSEVNAILILEKDQEPRLNLVDLSFTQRLAEHASIAIANAQINAELTRANDSKSEFVSFVAHELKTPMTSMKGFTDLLGMVGPINEQQNNFLNTIRTNIDRMNTLISDLNDVTKLQTNNMQISPLPMDFIVIINETLRPLAKQIEDKHQQVIQELEDPLPRVLADQNRMIQVLTNFMSNACKYSPEHTNITLRAVTQQKTLDSRGRDLGASLHVSVRDQGIGMSEEDLNKLFTPYFRSDNPLARAQVGTGLGLTITRGIVQQHNGIVWVESTLGEGTTFHFTLPIAPETESPEAPEPQIAK